jgi:hypothetical protein
MANAAAADAGVAIPPPSPTRSGAVLPLEPVAQGEDRGQQRDRRSVVRVAPGVGLDRQVLGDRDLFRQFGLFGGEVPLGDQFAGDLLGGRGEKLARHFDPRHLGDHAVRRDDPTVLAAADAGEPVADHVRGQVEERGGLGQADAVAEVEVHRPGLDRGLARAVDQVKAERPVAERLLDAHDRRLDPLVRQPGRPEEGEHPGRADRLDQFGRRDSVGHRACHVRESQFVVGTESGVAEG